MTTIGTAGSGDGEFNQLTRLLLSSTGLLFVCDTGNERVQVFHTQCNHQYQYSFGHQKLNIVDLTLNATEDKLFAVDYGAYILVFTPQEQFLRSIAVDGGVFPFSVFPFSIYCTSDGHLLVGLLVSSNFLSVYHEDDTLVCGGKKKSYNMYFC